MHFLAFLIVLAFLTILIALVVEAIDEYDPEVSTETTFTGWIIFFGILYGIFWLLKYAVTPGFFF